MTARPLPTEPAPPKKVKVTLSLTQTQYQDLKDLAEARGITFSALVTRGLALQRFLLENADGELLLKRGEDVHGIVLVG